MIRFSSSPFVSRQKKGRQPIELTPCHAGLEPVRLKLKPAGKLGAGI